MLQALTDMKITKKIVDAGDNSSDINILDQNYQKLKCKIDAVEKNSDEWNTIVKFVENTKGSYKSV